MGHRAENLEDDVLVDRLMENTKRLTEEELVAFRSMQEKGAPLSAYQRDWAENAYNRNSLHGMYEEGTTKKKKKTYREPYFWELRENRPLSPPGRDK